MEHVPDTWKKLTRNLSIENPGNYSVRVITNWIISFVVHSTMYCKAYHFDYEYILIRNSTRLLITTIAIIVHYFPKAILDGKYMVSHYSINLDNV